MSEQRKFGNVPAWLATELEGRGWVRVQDVPAADVAAVVTDRRYTRHVAAVLVAGVVALVALVALLVMHGRYEIAAGQRDEYRAELSQSAQVRAAEVQTSAVRVAGVAGAVRCGTPVYVDADGVRSVFLYQGTTVLPMPGAVAWHLVDEGRNVWALASERDGADAGVDSNGRSGWWRQVLGLWCGAGDPGVAQVSQVR